MMLIKHLGSTNINDIIACFLKAFEGYFVEMPTDYNYYKQRWKAAKVDFGLSFGMFDDNKLVGFIIHAVDKRDGEYIAYNSGTGVLPKYRGQKIVKAIYDFALPELKKTGITKSTLEVIIKNEKAIKAYHGVGFNICKNYKCFAGKIKLKVEIDFTTEEQNIAKVDWSKLPNQQYYSWDFNANSLTVDFYKYYNVYIKGVFESYFVINPTNGTIAQFDVINGDKGSWDRLFTVIASFSKKIRILNIDDRLNAKIQAVKTAGLKTTVNQYEMELLL